MNYTHNYTHNTKVILKFLIITLLIHYASLTIDGSGLSSRGHSRVHGEDPCNPLYWYPREVPEYCHILPTVRPAPNFGGPIPVPIPVPAPPPPPFYPSMMPVPAMVPPLPFGIPLIPTHPMIPVAGLPYNQLQPLSISPPQKMPLVPGPTQPLIGMVPGIPGMVSYDGGINIMPFSDAYSDLLEKHKQKMIRRRLQTFLDEYDRYPWKAG